MKDIFKDIQNYILFLRQKGYNVSFSSFDNRFSKYTEKLLQHEIHLHSVCSYLKSNPQTAGMCICNKAKLSKCKIKKSVYSCCYAGVEEYIFPVYSESDRIICIHISGYRNNLKRSHRLMTKTTLLCSPMFCELYAQLSTEKPNLKTVESFIKPLEYMLLSLYNECLTSAKTEKQISPTRQIYLKSLQYINDNYMNDISAEVIAEELKYSASYLRAIFKKESGTSLQNKINEVRLENAKYLLLNTHMNITDISFHCGFGDSNYFSVIFKKKFGLSPLIYKNTSRN